MEAFTVGITEKEKSLTREVVIVATLTWIAESTLHVPTGYLIVIRGRLIFADCLSQFYLLLDRADAIATNK